MNEPVHFGAPWGATLKFFTALGLVILVGVLVIGITTLTELLLNMDYLKTGLTESLVLIFLPLIVLFASFLFLIHGYLVTDGHLLIQRMGWHTRIDLRELKSLEVDDSALSGALRIAANGGLFVLDGWFWSRKMGRFLAYATDPDNAVVLHFPSRNMVISPEKPKEFVQVVKERLLHIRGE